MSKRMNVLHIMADQHHADSMGHEGHQQVISPNLDRLAASGMRFTRCYTQNTICTTCADSYVGMDGKPKDTPWCREIEAKGLQDKHEFYQSNLWGEPKQRASEIPFDMSQEGWSVREAIRFMDGCGDAPFCMQVSFERPHDPCVPAREFWDMYPNDIELPKSFTYPCDHRPPHFREMHES